jgi:hypothetical protein
MLVTVSRNQKRQDAPRVNKRLYLPAPLGTLVPVCIRGHEMEGSNLGLFTCRVCGKPVKLEDAKIDAAGHPVHQECAATPGTSESSHIAK